MAGSSSTDPVSGGGTVPSSQSAFLLALGLLRAVGDHGDDPRPPLKLVERALLECRPDYRPDLAAVLAVNLAVIADRYRRAAEAAGVDVEAIELDAWLSC